MATAGLIHALSTAPPVYEARGAVDKAWKSGGGHESAPGRIIRRGNFGNNSR